VGQLVDGPHTHYSRVMQRPALLIALLLMSSCKKDPPKGDLPPAKDWQSAQPGTPAAPPPTNPHAGMGDGNPHAGMGDGNPHGDMGGAARAEKTAPHTLEKLPDGRLALGPFAITPPADWTAKPIASSMRAADFVLPAKPGAEAELVVYYFGQGGAGSIDDNLDRWFGQFQQPDGKKSRDVAKIEKTKFAGQDATYVSVSGRFVAPAMPGATEAVDKQDQSLLAAIVGSPAGPYYFKLVGAKSTVDASAAAFRKMLESLQVR
jgi:hypothetical protein